MRYRTNIVRREILGQDERIGGEFGKQQFNNERNEIPYQ